MMTDAAINNVNATPVRRRLGTSTDDAAIFLEDTVDRMTAQCIDASPSAMALLTPQRLPAGHNAHVDMTEYDASHLGSLASSHRRSAGEGSYTSTNAGNNSSSKGRPSGHRSALHDVTNTAGSKLNFSSGPSSKSPTPTAARLSGPHAGHGHPRVVSLNSSLARSTPRHSTHGHSPSAAEPVVPLADFEALQKERNRFEKMYEHQRALYEEMAEKQAETYQTLQDKIIEVVALSTRNEESKRFIRQLKREFSESRTRVMDMQNKALEEAKSERNTKSRYEALIQSQERKYDRLVERHETKLAGMESLVKDLTCLRGDQDQLHVAQLDSLLKAAYAKSTALFSDLLRQGRQIDLLYEAKGDVESQLEQLRRERREMEAAMRDERRHTMAETERLIEQIEEQQQSILNLRQMLIRTMDNRDNVFAYSRGPRRMHGERDGDEDANTHSSSSSSSSFSSSPSSIAEDGEADRSLTGEDVEVEDDDDDDPLHGEVGRQVSGHDAAGEAGDREGRLNPLLVATTAATRLARSGGSSRPVISAAPSLASNAVVLHRRTATPAPTGPSKAIPLTEVPPLPLSTRTGSAERSGGTSTAVLRQEQPYRIQRTGEGHEAKDIIGKSFKSSSNNNSLNTSNSVCGLGAVGGRRFENDENAESGGSSASKVLTHRHRPLSTMAGSPHVREAAGEEAACAVEGRQRLSPSTSLAPDGTTSRRRLDFTSALAAVTEKRRRDRLAREEEASGNSSSSASIDVRSTTARDSNAGVVRREAGKENSSPAGGRRVIVRSCAVGAITTSRSTAEAEREEDEEEPRLFQRPSMCPREA